MPGRLAGRRSLAAPVFEQPREPPLQRVRNLLPHRAGPNQRRPNDNNNNYRQLPTKRSKTTIR